MFYSLPFCGITVQLISWFFWVSSQLTEFSQKNIYPSSFCYAAEQRAGRTHGPGQCGGCSGKVPLCEGSGQLQEEKQRLVILHNRHTEKESLHRVAVWGRLLVYVNSSQNLVSARGRLFWMDLRGSLYSKALLHTLMLWPTYNLRGEFHATANS